MEISGRKINTILAECGMTKKALSEKCGISRQNISTITETMCANLLDIAKVFDKIKGPTTPIYAEALREAAFVLWVFHYGNEKTVVSVTSTDDGKVELVLTDDTSTSNDNKSLGGFQDESTGMGKYSLRPCSQDRKHATAPVQLAG